MKTGRTDIMLGNMGWTPTRAQVMCITDAIYYAGTFVTMKKDQPFTADVGIDMKGRSIGTVTGFTIVPEMKKVPGRLGRSSSTTRRTRAFATFRPDASISRSSTHPPWIT